MTTELVPLGTRVRSLVALRVAMIGVVIVARLAMPDVVTGSFDDLAKLSGGYAALALIFEGLRQVRGSSRGLLSLGLLVDGIYLAWVIRTTGGGESLLRYLIVLHLVGVILLISYRTGLKLAAWHTILVFVVHDFEVRAAPKMDSGLAKPLSFTVAFLLVGLGAATFSAVNERELRRRRADLEALHNFAVALDDARHPHEVGGVLLEHSRAVLGFDRAVVIGARGGDVEVLAADERPGSESEDPLQIGPDSVVTKSWSRHGPVLVRRLDGEDDPWLSEVLGTTERVTVLPMFADGMPAGAVVGTVAGLSQDRIERRIVDTGEQLSAHAALALRNAWLLEDVEELAVTDSLTHLANRRHLEHALSTLLADAGRDGSELAFLLVDLDRFKALNDTHGHLVGDDVLRIVGSALRDAVRDVDVVGRWGGEEFAVVLPGCGTETATAAAERIRIAIGTMPGPVPVSASVGVSVYPADGTERGALLRAADQALYESKRRGRDRVTVANAQSAGWLDLPWSSVAMPDLPDQPDQPVEADQADTDPFDPRADEQERKTVA